MIKSLNLGASDIKTRGSSTGSTQSTLSSPQNTIQYQSAQRPSQQSGGQGSFQASQTQIPSSGTVEGRIEGLLDSNSPYMQAAQTRGLQQANQRGLLNSSMAVNAVEQARIAAALPIAQQDASLFGQAALQDSGFQNQGQLASQGFGHQSALNQQQFGHNTALNQQQSQLNQQSQAQQNQFTASQNQLQAQTQMQQNMASQIAQIEANGDIPPNIKAEQIQALQNIYQQQINQMNQAFQQQAQQYQQTFSTNMQTINNRFQFRG